MTEMLLNSAELKFEYVHGLSDYLIKTWEKEPEDKKMYIRNFVQ